MYESTLAWCATFTAFVGSALLAFNSSKWSKWGFVAFLVSNSLWIAWAANANAVPLLAQNIGFTATSVYGVWKWFRTGRKSAKRNWFERQLSALQIAFSVMQLRLFYARVPRSRKSLL